MAILDDWCFRCFNLLLKLYREPVFFAGYFVLSEQRSSYGDHRCVTPLYVIPMGIFVYVMDWAGGFTVVDLGKLKYFQH